MTNKLIKTLLIVAFLGFTLPSQTNAINLKESFFLKITVIENGIEHEWEYSNPGKYEYEQGEKVIKKKLAEESMKETLKIIDLSEKAKVEEMVEALKKNRFPEIERLDIRWMNGENKLYTWVWESN